MLEEKLERILEHKKAQDEALMKENADIFSILKSRQNFIPQ
jgi:phosphoribosyl-ATP pyrophosphohydrolase